jgi:hypothetical protein
VSARGLRRFGVRESTGVYSPILCLQTSRFPFPHGIRVAAANAEATLEFGVLKCDLRVIDWGDLATKRTEVVEKVSAARHSKALLRAQKMMGGARLAKAAPALTAAAGATDSDSAIASAPAKKAKNKRKREAAAPAAAADGEADSADAADESDAPAQNSSDSKPRAASNSKPKARDSKAQRKGKAQRANGANGATGAKAAAEDNAAAAEESDAAAPPAKRQRFTKSGKPIDPNPAPRKKKVFPQVQCPPFFPPRSLHRFALTPLALCILCPTQKDAALAIIDSVNQTVESKITRALTREVGATLAFGRAKVALCA